MVSHEQSGSKTKRVSCFCCVMELITFLLVLFKILFFLRCTKFRKNSAFTIRILQIVKERCCENKLPVWPFVCHTDDITSLTRISVATKLFPEPVGVAIISRPEEASLLMKFCSVIFIDSSSHKLTFRKYKLQNAIV